MPITPFSLANYLVGIFFCNTFIIKSLDCYFFQIFCCLKFLVSKSMIYEILNMQKL